MEIRKKIITYGIIFVFIIVLYFLRRRSDDGKKAIAEEIKRKPWFKTIIQEAKNYNLPYERVAAIVAVESGGNAAARGEAGEYGLMQIMPEAHKAVMQHWSRDGGGILGIRIGNAGLGWTHSDNELLNAEYNILVGCTYLAMLKKQFKGDLDKATEAYNDGGAYGIDYQVKVQDFQKYF